MKTNNFKRIDLLILFFILAIAVFFRLYKISTPLADFHSWRQVDTSAVTRNFVKNGIDLLHPIYDDLSNVQSGMDNPNGYRMVEFPIYNAIVAVLYSTFPFTSIEIWGRLTTIIFSLIIISIIYYLLLKENSRRSAIFASLLYSIFPFFVFFSRVVLPETTALAFAMLSIFFLYLHVDRKQKGFSGFFSSALAAFFFASALLVKPTVIFYLLPALVLFYRKYRLNLIIKLDFYLYFLITLIPLFVWRIYIKNYPAGIPGSDWLFTSVNTSEGLKNIMFRPSFFRWIFFERINNLILGGYMTFFFLLGVISRQKNKLILSFLIATLTYILVFQGGNVQHEYYQTLILPVLAMMIGLGIDFIFENQKNFINIFFVSLFIFLSFGFSFYFSYFRVIDYYQYSQELVQEAKIINSLTYKNDLIVTDRTGDTTLLYLSERRGAPSIFKDPADLKKLGYKYLITSSEGQISSMKSEFKIVFENEKFTLFRL